MLLDVLQGAEAGGFILIQGNINTLTPFVHFYTAEYSKYMFVRFRYCQMHRSGHPQVFY